MKIYLRMAIQARLATEKFLKLKEDRMAKISAIKCVLEKE
jgi:hypothetical protein